jgi:hypothetical protein
MIVTSEDGPGPSTGSNGPNPFFTLKSSTSSPVTYPQTQTDFPQTQATIPTPDGNLNL